MVVPWEGRPRRHPQQHGVDDAAGLDRGRVNVAGRVPDLIPDNDRTEVGGVVNYYLNKHSLKFQGDFRQIDDDGRGTKNKELRLQTQVVF